jgi:hypothetical protein
MSERIAIIKQALTASAEEARQKFGSLSAEQLNWKPAENSWSVAQCLEHLIKTNAEFYPEFEKLASGTRRNTAWQSYSPLTGFFGRFLIKAVTEDSKKAKTPSNRIVPGSDVDPMIVEHFFADIGNVNEKIDACSEVDLRTTVVSSPFVKLITYRLDDAYTVLVEHTKRHIRQAERVMQTPGFPGSNEGQLGG